MAKDLYSLHCPDRLPGPGKPSPMMWALVPDQIQTQLLAEGCMLLKHWARRHHLAYVRFQYAPLVYEGDLFYLQRWAPIEWSVSPSQLTFPHEGWPCTENTRSNGNYLSVKVRQAIARQYPEPALSFKSQPQPRLVTAS